MDHSATVRLRHPMLVAFFLAACATSAPNTVVQDAGFVHDAGNATDTPVTNTDGPGIDALGTDVQGPDAAGADVQGIDSGMETDVVDNDVAQEDAALDAAEPDAGPVGTDVGPVDTGVDAGTMDVAANACVAAGGSCVPLVPGSCPSPGTSGGFSCGTGLGITCCVPGDAGTVRDSGVDVHTDAHTDVRPVDAGNPCQAAGGMCVALTPTSCPAPGMVGSSTTYSCGTGLGIECCLPADAGTVVGPPQCLHTGTSTEGWYTPSGTLLCNVTCAGLPTPACQRVGETSQGWYTTSGHGCPPDSELIVHDYTCT